MLRISVAESINFFNFFQERAISEVLHPIAFLEQCPDSMGCVRHVCIGNKWKNYKKLQVADERPELRFSSINDLAS